MNLRDELKELFDRKLRLNIETFKFIWRREAEEDLRAFHNFRILADERWHTPSDDESGWFPIRPNKCVDKVNWKKEGF